MRQLTGKKNIIIYVEQPSKSRKYQNNITETQINNFVSTVLHFQLDLCSNKRGGRYWSRNISTLLHFQFWNYGEVVKFFLGKLMYVLKEEDTNIIRGIPQIYNDNRNIKQQMATG